VDSQFFDIVRKENPRKILFAGRIYALKGIRELLQAISRVDDAAELTLVLAGSEVDKQYVDQLRADASRFNLMNVVKFRGILRTEELLKELSECACLVLPSYQETAPMVIQEAMACGVPVIASNICGIPYQVDDGKTGFLVPPGDIDAIADRLSKLLSNHSMRQRFGALAKLRAERDYRAETVAAKTVDVYRDMLQ